LIGGTGVPPVFFNQEPFHCHTFQTVELKFARGILQKLGYEIIGLLQNGSNNKIDLITTFGGKVIF
jgi:hypothetical protein